MIGFRLPQLGGCNIGIGGDRSLAAGDAPGALQGAMVAACGGHKAFVACHMLVVPLASSFRSSRPRPSETWGQTFKPPSSAAPKRWQH